MIEYLIQEKKIKTKILKERSPTRRKILKEAAFLLAEEAADNSQKLQKFIKTFESLNIKLDGVFEKDDLRSLINDITNLPIGELKTIVSSAQESLGALDSAADALKEKNQAAEKVTKNLENRIEEKPDAKKELEEKLKEAERANSENAADGGGGGKGIQGLFLHILREYGETNVPNAKKQDLMTAYKGKDPDLAKKLVLYHCKGAFGIKSEKVFQSIINFFHKEGFLK